MAQKKLSECCIKFSTKIGDSVTDYQTNGKTWTSQMREDYINAARKQTYNEILTELGEKAFIRLFPEWMQQKSITLSPKPTDVRTAMRIYYQSVIIHKVPPELEYDALYNTYTFHKAQGGKYWFVERDTSIVVIGIASPGSAPTIYLSQPVDVAIDPADDDIPDPELWITQIVENALLQFFSDIQKHS